MKKIFVDDITYNMIQKLKKDEELSDDHIVFMALLRSEWMMDFGILNNEPERCTNCDEIMCFDMYHDEYKPIMIRQNDCNLYFCSKECYEMWKSDIDG